MKFSFNWLKKLAGFKKSPQELAELLTLRSFEVESVKKMGGNFALDIKIPANRISDAANHEGMAKEIAAITKSKIKNQKSKLQIKIKKSADGEKNTFPIQIKIEKPELCPRYTAQVLEVDTKKQSPRWMQERLITCGFRPINSVIDITNYVMLETGQPLHAFDFDKTLPTNYESGRITNKTLTIREVKYGEELITLDGTKHRLPAGTIVIEDRKRLIDLAGIMGGENSAVSEKTQKIILQAAVFDPTRIYKTSRALNFHSEASKIYSAGIDPNHSLAALERAIELLKGTAGAKETGGIIDIYPQKVLPAKILFRPSYANGIIGQNPPSAFYKSAFTNLGFQMEVRGENLLITVPTARQDIKLEEDLIEEATRIFGYENIKEAWAITAVLPPKRNNELFWQYKIADALSGAGFSESLLYEFTGERELEKYFIDNSFAPELENPTRPETKYLTSRALIKYVSSAAENLANFNEVKIFGFAKSFKKTGNGKREAGSGTYERKDLIIVLAKKGTRGEEEFFLLKGVLDQLFESLGINDCWYNDNSELRIKNSELRIFHPYRNAEIKIGNEKIGHIGEIHPAVGENIKARARIAAAEIDFEKLWRLANEEQEFRPIGKYPAVTRDIALIVPFYAKTEEVLDVLTKEGGELLIDADLFDYFQDDAMRMNQVKNLAFHLTFQSPDRTLKDGEINKLIGKITRAFTQKGWRVRE